MEATGRRAGSVPVSKQDLEKFIEELKQFEVDTEFVWSLWKETQKESPNMTGILSKSLTKEKQKHNSHILELMEKLQDKEKQLSLLRGNAAREKSKAEEILKNQVTLLEIKLQEKESIIEDCSRKLQDLSVHKATLNDRNKEIKLLKMEVSCEVDKCAGLKEKLMACETELREVRYSCATGKQEMSQLKDELEDVIESREEKVDFSSMQTANMKILLEQNQKYRKEIASLKEKWKKAKVSRSCDYEGSTPKEKLRMKNQILDLKSLLKAKSDELANLRSVHNRRLERMRSLKAGYELALDQIKTYESKGSCRSDSRTPRRKDDALPSVRLQQEDSEGVWNELAYYRSSCGELKGHMLVLEEERDSLKEQCLHAQTELANLRSSDNTRRDDIEEKISAIAAAEVLTSEKMNKKEQISELECAVKRLKVERARREKRMAIHTAEGRKQKHSLSQKLRSVDRFTMTDFELTGEKSPPCPPHKLLKDASSMTDSTPSILLVHSAVQASKKFKDVGCQSELPTTELIPSKSSYYSLSNCSDQRCTRSYSDSEFTLVPEKSCAGLGKDIPPSESDTTVMLTPVASVRTVKETSRTIIESSFKGSRTVEKTNIPRSETRIVARQDPLLGDGTDEQRKGAESSVSRLKGCLESASSSSAENMRKFSKRSTHKHMWREQVKTLQQRLRTQRRQVAVLNTTKQMLKHRVDEESSQRRKSEAEQRDLFKKHQAMKQIMEAMKSEKLKLTQETKGLQASMSLLKVTHHTETEWKKIESQHKELQNKCASLNSSLKFMQTTMEAKSSELASALDRCSKLERDVKQKRLLIEEYRRKQVTVNDVLSAKDADIKQLADSMKGLTEAIEQDKQKVKSMHLQLTKARNERECLKNSSKHASEETRHLHDQHERDVKLKKSLNQKLVSLEWDLQSQEREHQIELNSLKTEAKRLQYTVEEFKTFTIGVADLLMNAFKEDQLKRTSFVHNSETDALAGRVREIARSALNLSEFELDDFFDNNTSTHQVLSEANVEEHEAFKDFVESKMFTKLKKSFAGDLLVVFGEYVNKNVKDIGQS